MTRLYLTTYSGFPTPNSGGSNKIIYEIGRHLHREDYSIHYLSYDLHAPMTPATSGDEYKAAGTVGKRLGKSMFKYNPLYRWIVTRKFYYPIHAKKRERYFSSLCARIVPDLVHAHHPLGFFNWIGDPRVKKILTIHSKGSFVQEMRGSGQTNFIPDEVLAGFEELETLAYNTADVVTFPSKAAYEMFVGTKRAGTLDRKKVEILHNGIDVDGIRHLAASPDFLASYGVPGGRKIVLNVANHVKFKNIGLLIEAVARFNRSHKERLYLINISTGPMAETSKLSRMVSELCMENDCRFIFGIPNEDVIRFMKNSFCFVMPGTQVVFDMVILEALAAGCRIIVSNDGGNREIITEGVNGFFLHEISAEAIEACLQRTVQEPARLVMPDHASVISAAEMTRRYEHLYSECLRGS